MGIVDAVLICLLIVGALDGVRKGAIRSIVEFVGSILVIVLSWMLKNNFANILIKVYPNIGKNVAVSAIIYNVIAFLILLIAFSILLFVILKITDFIENVFKATIVLGFLSKIVGALFGAIKAYILIFFALLIMRGLNIRFIEESKVSDFMLEKTPLVTPLVEKSYNSIKKAYESTNPLETIEYLFNNKIITEDNLNKLKEIHKKDNNEE